MTKNYGPSGIYEVAAATVDEARGRYRRAAIIRQIGPGQFLVFGTVPDAFMHPTRRVPA